METPSSTSSNTTAAQRINFLRMRRQGNVPNIEQVERDNLNALRVQFADQVNEVHTSFNERAAEINELTTTLLNGADTNAHLDSLNTQVNDLNARLAELNNRRREMQENIAKAKTDLKTKKEAKNVLLSNFKELEELLDKQKNRDTTADKIATEGGNLIRTGYGAPRNAKERSRN